MFYNTRFPDIDCVNRISTFQPIRLLPKILPIRRWAIGSVDLYLNRDKHDIERLHGIECRGSCVKRVVSIITLFNTSTRIYFYVENHSIGIREQHLCGELE